MNDVQSYLVRKSAELVQASLRSYADPSVSVDLRRLAVIFLDMVHDQDDHANLPVTHSQLRESIRGNIG